MEIVLDEGRGYVSGERNKQNMPQGVIGELAVDSIYTPVSYTHLRRDRRSRTRARASSTLMRLFAARKARPVRVNNRLGAVSYTHLDVYKRQAERLHGCFRRTVLL